MFITAVTTLITGCNTLPQKPHTNDSIYLTQRLYKLYNENEFNAFTSSIEKPIVFSDTISISPLINPLTNVLSTYTIAQKLNLSITSTDTNSINTNSSDYTTSKTVNASMVKSSNPNNYSFYYPIISGSDALSFRRVLSDFATQSIDVQYYIWHNDATGQFMLKTLWEAAERGVIVRLLLDDFNSNNELDKHLSRLASHPNIAVRLINPLLFRRFKTLNYFFDLKRVNKRMHNKSMTFDRSISIIGGRNIGDAYLSTQIAKQFADLDVALIGPVVNNISDSFDEYWDASISYDIQTLVNHHNTNHAEKNQNVYNPFIGDKTPKHETFEGQLNKVSLPSETEFINKNHDLNNDFVYHLNFINIKYTNPRTTNINNFSIDKQLKIESDLKDKFLNQQVIFKKAPIVFVSDSVDKLTNQAHKDTYLVEQLRKLLGTPNEQLTIISSYFVPTKDGVETLLNLANQGVKIKILTNSFDATDVGAVHAGYAEWRYRLLEAGIEIYEHKAIASEEERENKLWRARSQSSTSLHAKTFAVDDHSIFVGSYNVDPRSADLNTEIGVVIEDKTITQQLHDTINDNLLTHAYKVELTDKGTLRWKTIEQGKLIYFNSEPKVGIGTTLFLKIASILPIDWLL